MPKRPADVVANIGVCLTHQANYLLDRKIKKLENDTVTKGGIKEQMYRARSQHRSAR
ncbi:hypothetical protein JIN82_11010 [Persicirhabdus sediminis]|uniref:Uncharacterized protein n=1 Tax=Persicirhabdus sediminis TaxID=454144 RepID=A0A8J7SKF4_9BACT|nr:hypothetical protein [Persicirhabdus sediminis]